jgi:hypothetical protein
MKGRVRGGFLERRHRRGTHVNLVWSRGRGSTSLQRERHESVDVARRSALTREQFLARFDLRVDLYANNDLPTQPSGVLRGLSDNIRPSGAVQSAKRL